MLILILIDVIFFLLLELAAKETMHMENAAMITRAVSAILLNHFFISSSLPWPEKAGRFLFQIL